MTEWKPRFATRFGDFAPEEPAMPELVPQTEQRWGPWERDKYSSDFVRRRPHANDVGGYETNYLGLSDLERLESRVRDAEQLAAALEEFATYAESSDDPGFWGERLEKARAALGQWKAGSS